MPGRGLNVAGFDVLVPMVFPSSSTTNVSAPTPSAGACAPAVRDRLAVVAGEANPQVLRECDRAVVQVALVHRLRVERLNRRVRDAADGRGRPLDRAVLIEHRLVVASVEPRDVLLDRAAEVENRLDGDRSYSLVRGVVKYWAGLVAAGPSGSSRSAGRMSPRSP